MVFGVRECEEAWKTDEAHTTEAIGWLEGWRKMVYISHLVVALAAQITTTHNPPPALPPLLPMEFVNPDPQLSHAGWLAALLCTIHICPWLTNNLHGASAVPPAVRRQTRNCR